MSMRRATADVFPSTEEYALREPLRLGSRKINASVFSGVKSVLRKAGKTEAKAGDLPMCSSFKSICNCRADTASLLETEIMVAP